MLRAMHMHDRLPTLTDMPEGFWWAPRCHLDTIPTGLYFEGECLIALISNNRGGWFALFNLRNGLHKPIMRRDCTSFENGRRGAELWCARHIDEVRAFVAAKKKWIWENVVCGGRGTPWVGDGPRS